MVYFPLVSLFRTPALCDALCAGFCFPAAVCFFLPDPTEFCWLAVVFSGGCARDRFTGDTPSVPADFRFRVIVGGLSAGCEARRRDLLTGELLVAVFCGSLFVGSCLGAARAVVFFGGGLRPFCSLFGAGALLETLKVTRPGGPEGAGGVLKPPKAVPNMEDGPGAPNTEPVMKEGPAPNTEPRGCCGASGLLSSSMILSSSSKSPYSGDTALLHSIVF